MKGTNEHTEQNEHKINGSTKCRESKSKSHIYFSSFRTLLQAIREIRSHSTTDIIQGW